MKQLNNFILEKLKLNKEYQESKYSCCPKNKEELQKIIEKRLKKDKNASLNDIDVSYITDMSYLFEYLDPHNIYIEKWDVSNVTNMQEMFMNCENFNCDLSDWDVSNVNNMTMMFYGCKKFEGEGLENWNINNVDIMLRIFDKCTSLKNKPRWKGI